MTGGIKNSLHKAAELGHTFHNFRKVPLAEFVVCIPNQGQTLGYQLLGSAVECCTVLLYCACARKHYKKDFSCDMIHFVSRPG
mmetsp:Transcript_72767/g.173712  ORF Transcript_72767/g.173712 Transcript_72767/m.173712 type:complete len:83 (-) Transcript_72767:220-468(-)